MLVIKESVFSWYKTAGVSATKLDKLGWRADTAEIAFDNVEIQWRIWWEKKEKVSYIMQHLLESV
jgi:hypothetical protein